MGVTIIDLVSDSSDEEENDGEAAAVETKKSARSTTRTSNNNGGKRKIVEGESKKEPNRKNPWFRNSNTATVTSSSAFSNIIQSTGLTFAQRVSPVLEDQKKDDDNDDEVIIVDDKENPPNFTAAVSTRDAKKVWPSKASAAITTTSSSSAATATKTITNSIGNSLKLQEPPLKIWCHSDNAVITPGVLPALGALRGGNLLVSNAVSVPHIQQSDNWSCGFRNIQMLLSGLVPLLPSTHPYFQSITHVYSQVPTDLFLGTSSLLVLPSLTQLQQQLEACWREGFDPNGADHFRYSVVGRPSRIGAVEVGFVLSYWWLDACVVQFIKCFQSRRLLPPFVYHYFRACHGGDQRAQRTALDCLDLAEMGTASISGNGSAAADSNTTNITVLPMYLQWEGHSVTIVGIEPPPGAANGDIGKYSWSQWNLLVFCPGRNCSRFMASKNTATTPAPFRLSCRQLLQKDCQIILSSTEPLLSSQRMDRKNKAVFVETAASAAVSEHAQRAW